MRIRLFLAAPLVLLALAGCSGDDEKPASSGSTAESSTSSTPTSTTVAPGSTTSSSVAPAPAAGIALTGAAVVPGPGDADGSGTVVVRLVPERSEVCYELTARNIDPAIGAQLRRGRTGQVGETVLAFKAPTGGSVSSCAAADAVLVADLQASPGDFHVLVLNETFPKGALRGQLR